MPRLSVSRDGTITAIYSDELVELNKRGEVSIERASNVEPITVLVEHATRRRAGWQAVMTDGTVLPACETREQALALEVAYLERKLFNS
jgi:hypothetical protein